MSRPHVQGTSGCKVAFWASLLAAAMAGCGSSAKGGNGGQGGGGAGGANGDGPLPGDGGSGAGGTGSGPSSDGGWGTGQGCGALPPVSDYSQPGPFNDVQMFTATGPNGGYTIFRATATLGMHGFKHPIATWGNGIMTTPDEYQKTLSLIASHGFVIIACNDTQAEMPCLSAGLDWLVAQNTASGPLQGHLDTQTEVTLGYSWGGGAAIDTSVRPNVKATVSLHGMPPRQDGVWAAMHAPLMLTTSTGDNFVTASGYVTPNYDSSQVQTFYATQNDSTVGHLYVVDEGEPICIGGILAATYGVCGNDTSEHALTIGWLRLWACGDERAKGLFYGSDCTYCKSPWSAQRKNWN